MASLDQIRQRYASARDLTDNELIAKLSEITETPYEQVASRFGFDQKTSRGFLGAANDYAIEAANAAAGLAKGVTDFVSPGNAAGQFIQENIIEPGEANQSVPATLAKRQLQRGLQSDEFLPQAGAVASYVAQNPLLAASQAVGSFGPIGGALKGAQVASGLAGLGARGASRVGLGTSAALSGAAAGGDAGSAAYELVMNTPWETVSRHPQAVALIDAGANPDQVYEELATRAARKASVVPAIIGAVSGATGAESALASGVKGLKGVVKKVGAETLGETFEEGATQYAGQAAAQEYNPEINPMQGVYGSGLLGGALGAMVATPVSLASMERDKEKNLLDPAAPTAPQTPAPVGLVTQPVPLQERINEQLGIGQKPVAGKKYAAQFEAAFNEPSGQYGQDPETGIERELTVGELMQRGVAPMDLTVANPAATAAASTVVSNVTKSRDPQDILLRDTLNVIPNQHSRALLTAMAESGIDPESKVAEAVWNYAGQKYMTPARLTKALAILDESIIEARKGTTNVSPTTAPISTAPTGVATGSPVVSGSVGLTGPSVASNVQPSAGPVLTGTPTGQAQPAPATVSQPATPVIQGTTNGPQAPQAKQTKAQGQAPTTRGAAGTTPLVDTSDDALEIARATGNAAEIEAMREDEAGLRTEVTSLSEEDATRVIGARFAKSKNAKRDTEILNAYLTALRTNAGTDKAAIQNAIGDKYGITAVAVRKIGNPSMLVAAGAELGFSPEQVLDLFNVDDNTKAQFTEIGKLESEIRDLRKAYNKATDADKRNEVADRMAALSERITKIKEKADQEKSAAFSAGLQEAGVSGAEGESAGFGFDTEREWSRVEGESKVASDILELSNQIESLQEAAAKLDAQGQFEAADKARNAIAARQAKIDAVLATVQAETKPVASKAAPDVAEARKRWNDAGRDLTKLSTEDLQVLKGYTASINNKALSDKIAAEISSRGAPQEATRAVQVKGATSVSVQPKAEASQRVGQEVRSTEKPASKGEVAVLTPQEQYEEVTAGFPVPAWTDLTQTQQGKLTDLANRDQLNLAAVNRFVAAQVTDESNIIDVEARVVDDIVKPQIAKLAAPQVDRLEKHYGVGRNTAEFVAKVKADIVLYVNKGASAVAGAIRDVIKAMAEGVLAVSLIFNPNANLDRFEFNVQQVMEETREVRADVPAEAAAKMSQLAKDVYSRVAPAAMASGKSFIVADKPNGMIHVFTSKGKVIVQDTALFGMDTGDVMTGQKITPAGKFTMKAQKWEDYAGGFTLDVWTSKGEFEGVAIHAAYLGVPSQNRISRLATPTAADNKISGGCINTAHDTFIKKIIPNLDTLDGGMLFILPDAQETTASLFPAETKTTKTPIQDTKTTSANRTQVGKEESVDDTVQRILRVARQATPLFSTDLYLGKENVVGQPQSGRELRNPITLADGTRLDGFTSLDQSVFSGYDRNGQRITMAQSSVKPEDIVSSRDSNRTANAVKAALGPRVLRLERGDTVAVTAGTLKFDGSITDEASLRRFPGVESALAHYENNDLRHVIDGVELWMVAPDTVDFDAAILMVNGKQTLAVRSGMLVDSDKADWSIHHELGHIADDAFRTGGIYSSAPELNLTIQKGVVRPMGSVVQEIMDHIADNPDSPFAATMGYPLDRSRDSTKNLTADEVRMEVFAQLWAMYNRRYGRDYLADNLPLTFDFMELNDEAAKQDQGSADTQAGAADAQPPQQGQTNRGSQGVAPAILRIARPSEGLIAKNVSKLPKGAQQPVRNSLAAIGDVTGKGLDYLVFTSDLVNRASKEGIASAKKFVDLIGQSKAEARANEIAVEKIADMYALVPEKDRGTGEDSVNRFLFDSTREAKWGYGQYRDVVMGARFDKLSKESQAFVEAVFKHGSTTLAQKKKVVLDSTNSEYDALIALAQAEVAQATDKDALDKAKLSLSSLKAEKTATIKRFQTLFKIRDGMPYAPIKRNGSHVVIAKSAEYEAAEKAKDTKLIEKLEADSDHYHVSFTDGKWEGRTLQQELIDQGAFASVELAERDSVVNEMFSGHSALRELTKMRSRVDEQAKAGDKSASKMLSLISQMYLEALAEGSARKSEMRRRGVAGEVDMIRSFAQQGRADANFMASVKYNPQVQKALQEMRTQAKGGNRERRSELLNELAKRYIQSLEYSPRPWLNKLTRMSSIYYLATSPAYYLQNLTQPWMMSVPAMAGRHDYTAASGALFKAYTELGGVMKSAKLLKQQFDFDKVPADVRDAIKELVNRGKIDIGLDTEIGEFKVEGDGYFAGKISAADKALRLAVQKVESINRLSTAMAAYRLELAKGKDAASAINYADRILTETHGDYTSFNAPRAFNSPVGKVALQFRKFQLIQLAFYAKLIKDALQGNDRKAAFKTLTYSLSHTALLAGLMGMPGYAAIAWAIGAAFGDDDEPYDLTAEIRKAVGDESVANLVLKGAPTLAGMDISGKVGAGTMLSIMPFSQADLSTNAGRAEALGTLVGGASLGMTSRMVDGVGLMLGGDWYRGIEQTMPKGISDAMKAYRIADEGLTRRNGDVVLPASEISTMDSLFQAIGISPVQQTATYERQNAVKELTKNFQDRTTELKNQYAKAVRNGDSAGMAKARESWTKLQAAKANNGLPRKPLSDLLKAPAEQRKREKETAGGVQYTKATKKLAQQYSEI